MINDKYYHNRNLLKTIVQIYDTPRMVTVLAYTHVYFTQSDISPVLLNLGSGLFDQFVSTPEG